MFPLARTVRLARMPLVMRAAASALLQGLPGEHQSWHMVWLLYRDQFQSLLCLCLHLGNWALLQKSQTRGHIGTPAKLGSAL